MHQLLRPLALSEHDRISLSLDQDGDNFIVDIYGLWAGEKSYASPAARIYFLNRVPEKKHNQNTGKYLFPATDINVVLISQLWPEEQVLFETQEARVLYEYLRLTNARKDAAAEVAAKYHSDGFVPSHSFTLREEQPLSKYQQCALYCAMNNEGHALFMEQGTGKTPIVIARVCNEARGREKLYRAIVVCPNNVRLNWAREFEKFSTTPGRVTVIRGGEIERAKLLLDAMKRSPDIDYSVVVISYESLQRTWALLQMIEWDLAVLDESHYIKSPTTKRWKYAQKLRDRSKARMCLTGTPITNTPLDLYTQFEFLGKGWSGFYHWKNFRNFYGVYTPGHQGFERLVGVQNLPFMRERLARQSFIIRKSQALPDLPEKVYDVIEVEMTEVQSEIYKKILTELALEIDDELGHMDTPRQLVVNNILTKLLKLAQVTSGFVSYGEEVDAEGEVIAPKIVDRLDPNPKIDALVELLREKEPWEKTIVWACWVQDIKTIAVGLRLEGVKHVTFYGATSEVEREEAERAFNCDSETRVFIGNPAAGGVGLNLLGHLPNDDSPSSCNHVIYFSQNWSPTARSQSEDRAHRRGTRHNVRITDLCVPNSIDEEIRARVLMKRNMALEVADIRTILSNILRGYNA